MTLPRAIAALAFAALPAAAAAGPLQELRNTVVETPAAGLPYAEALERAGDGERAALLRLGLLTAHVAQLNGQSWRSTPTLGEVLDAAQSLQPPAMGSLLAADWQRAFNRHVELRWDGAPPAELKDLLPQLRPVGVGAWVGNAPGSAQAVAAVVLVNRSPAPLTLPEFSLRIAATPSSAQTLFCRPPAGPAAVDPAAAVPTGGERSFVCRGTAIPGAGELLARASQSPRRGDSPVTMEASHFRSAAGYAALAAAVGSASRVDVATWVARLQPAAPIATPPATAAAPRAAAAPSAAATAQPSRPRPPAAWRTSLAVAGSFSVLLFAIALVYGRLNEDEPVRTVARTLPWVLGLMLLGVLVGSPWGQAAWVYATGSGMVDLAHALRRGSEAAPEAAGLDALAAHLGLLSPMLGVGLVFFWLERLLMRVGASPLLVKLLTIPLRMLVFAPLAMGLEAPGADLVRIVLTGVVIGMIVGLLVGSLVVSWTLHWIFERMDDEDLTWRAAIWRAVTRSLDFGGRSGRGELWGYLLFALLASWLSFVFLPAWCRAVTAVVALPLPALLLRRLRDMDEAETWDLALWILRLGTGRPSRRR